MLTTRYRYRPPLSVVFRHRSRSASFHGSWPSLILHGVNINDMQNSKPQSCGGQVSNVKDNDAELLPGYGALASNTAVSHIYTTFPDITPSRHSPSSGSGSIQSFRHRDPPPLRRNKNGSAMANHLVCQPHTVPNALHGFRPLSPPTCQTLNPTHPSSRQSQKDHLTLKYAKRMHIATGNLRIPDFAALIRFIHLSVYLFIHSFISSRART